MHSGQRQGHDETDGSEAAPPEVPVVDTTPEEAARKSDSEDKAKSAGLAAAEAVSVIDSLAPMRAAGDILQNRRGARLDSLDEEGEGEQSTTEHDSASSRAGEEEGASVPKEGVVVDVAVESKADEEPNNNEEEEEVPVEQWAPSETGPQPEGVRQPTVAAASRADEAKAEAEEVEADPPPSELRKSSEGRERKKKGTAMAPSSH